MQGLVNFDPMVLLYNLATGLFFLGIRLASFFSKKVAKLQKGQNQLLEQMRSAFEGEVAPVIWIHAASLGEFEQGRPIIEALKSKRPDHKILLTFFSPSGYEVRKNFAGADYVFYLPFDNQANSAAFFDITKPVLCILIKYEFWYHYIQRAADLEIPLLSVSTIFKPSQPFFKAWGGLHRKMLHAFHHFFVQNQESLDLLESIGVNKTTISGDTRYDRVLAIANAATPNSIAKEFKGQKLLLVAGSTWPSDTKIIATTLIDNCHHAKAIIAPHEIHESEIQRLLALFPKSIAYSQAQNVVDLSPYNFLIIDNIGMLSSLYQYADIAFVGGGFHGGLHNTLEAAAWGVPVIFGAHEKNSKFQEAIDLREEGGGFEVATTAEFAQVYAQLVENTNDRVAAGKNARAMVNSNGGATLKIMDYICENLL